MIYWSHITIDPPGSENLEIRDLKDLFKKNTLVLSEVFATNKGSIGSGDGSTAEICCQSVHQIPFHVLSCVCDNACKRSLAICHKSPVSRLLSVPFSLYVLHGDINMI